MINSIIDTVNQLRNLLEEYNALMLTALAKGDQENDPPALMLQRGFKFAQSTLCAVALLAQARDGEYGLQACTLSRPLFEIAARLLWATRADDGWERLQYYWADEDRKWAQGMRNHSSSNVQHLDNLLNNRREILNRHNEQNVQSPPNIEQTLQEIEQHDIADELVAGGKKLGKLHYDMIYRSLCRPAHGHISALGVADAQGLWSYSRYGIILGSGWVIEAICHVGPENPRAEIEKLVERIKTIAGS